MKYAPALLFALCATLSAQSVHRVSAGGSGGAFPTVQSAIDAAQSGDLVLIESGTYANFDVDKPLVVAADAGASVTIVNTEIGGVDCTVCITDLGPASEVVLSGFSIQGLTMEVSTSAIEVLGGPERLFVQDVDVALSLRTFMLGATLELEDCDSATVVDCSLDATNSQALTVSGAAVRASNTNLFLYGSTLEGTHGFPGAAEGEPGLDGSPALEVYGGTTLVAGSELEGGRGGDGFAGTGTSNGGDGGPALLADSGLSPASVVTLDSGLAGGPGGSAVAPSVPGTTGPTTELGSAIVQTPTATARVLEADAVVRDGTATTITFRGEPFEPVWHVLGFGSATAVYEPDVLGAYHVGGSPIFVKYRGLLDAAGQKALTFTPAPTGLVYVPLVQQALMLDGTGSFVASNPRFTALIDSAIP